MKIRFYIMLSEEIKDEWYIKIGITSNLRKRISAIQRGVPFQIAETFYMNIESLADGRKYEKFFKELLKKYNTRGEWFVFNDGTFNDILVPATESFQIMVENTFTT